MSERDHQFFAVRRPASAFEGALYPLRRALRRVQRPWFYHLRDLLESVDHDLGALNGRVNQLRAEVTALQLAASGFADQIAGVDVQLTRLADDVAAVEAMRWDHTAVVRRLAALERRIFSDATSEDGQSDTRP